MRIAFGWAVTVLRGLGLGSQVPKAGSNLCFLLRPLVLVRFALQNLIFRLHALPLGSGAVAKIS